MDIMSSCHVVMYVGKQIDPTQWKEVKKGPQVAPVEVTPSPSVTNSTSPRRRRAHHIDKHHASPRHSRDVLAQLKAFASTSSPNGSTLSPPTAIRARGRRASIAHVDTSSHAAMMAAAVASSGAGAEGQDSNSSSPASPPRPMFMRQVSLPSRLARAEDSPASSTRSKLTSLPSSRNPKKSSSNANPAAQVSATATRVGKRDFSDPIDT